MIIDCHAHIVPPALLDAIRTDKASFPSIKLIEEGGSLGFSFAGNKPTRPVSKPLSDLAARLAWITTHLTRLAREQPRFVPLATVPLQDGARAAEVLKEAHSQGFKGAMIGTQPKGRGGVLDDPSLLPFWKTANSLGSIIFIHPVFESGDDRVQDYVLTDA